MSAPASKVMSLDEFLAWEAEQELHYELVDGRPIMMTGGTRSHGDIIGGIYAVLRNALKSSPCRAQIEFKLVCPNGNVRYPDVLIDCGQIGRKDLVASDPHVVIEVLSASSRAIDYFTKLKEYDSIPAIHTYLIFAQDTVRVTIFRRKDGALDLDREAVGLEAVIELPDLGIMLPLATVYDGLDFGPDAD